MGALTSLRRSTSPRRSAIPATPVPVVSPFLEQAEVCREQARDAARLKRFCAALGLFATASALCGHALKNPALDDPTRARVQEYLEQIDLEVSTYSELARVSNRA